MIGHTSTESGSRLGTEFPRSARVWSYLLGGKDHFAADRRVAEQIRAVHPAIVDVARASRAFLVRAVSYLAGEVGVEQFMDVGCGLPAAPNTHEAAQRHNPGVRVVYCDHDPMVAAHARALLADGPGGAVAVVEADLHDVDAVVFGASHTLDFTQPIGVILVGVLGYLRLDTARDVVRRLLATLPTGSFLIVADGTVTTPASAQAARIAHAAGIRYRLRSVEQIGGFLHGLQLLPPGVGPVIGWRPDPGYRPGAGADQAVGGVGCKR